MVDNEQALTFECDGERLLGILHPAAVPARRGILIVVGGPQYRAGSHRQFTLLARDLAAHGIPAFRFDYRGMGDSDGPMRSFEDIGSDIRAAIDEFLKRSPGLSEVVIWGLCDAASAATFYARRDRRVCGVVLLNPWVRTVEGIARARFRHYYLARIFDRELWRKIFRGAFDYRAAARSFVSLLRDVLGRAPAGPGDAAARDAAAPAAAVPAGDLPERMARDLAAFDGRVLLVLSGNDLTAREFVDAAQRSRRWQDVLSSQRVVRRELAAATHTFSSREWRDTVARWTREWSQSW